MIWRFFFSPIKMLDFVAMFDKQLQRILCFYLYLSICYPEKNIADMLSKKPLLLRSTSLGSHGIRKSHFRMVCTVLLFQVLVCLPHLRNSPLTANNSLQVQGISSLFKNAKQFVHTHSRRMGCCAIMLVVK